MVGENNQKQRVINHRKLIENYFYITDKDRNTVLLKFKPVQEKVYNKIRDLKRKKKPVRLIMLKARQLGMSTLTEALGCSTCISKKNQEMLIISHRTDTSDHLFSMTKYYVDNLPSELKPEIKKDNENTLIFDNKEGTGLHSEIRVMTANPKTEDGAGRGFTFSFVHLSEYDFWECNSEKVLASILSSCTDDSIVIIESTANGVRYLKKLWDDAVSKKANNDPDAIWEPMFFAWYQDEQYETDYVNADLVKTLTEEEKDLLEIFKVDDFTKDLSERRWLQKLQWRRKKIYEMNGNLEMFHQEYPSTPEEAFITSGESVFNNSIIAQRLREVAQEHYEDRGYYEYTLEMDEYTQQRRIKEWKWVSNKDGWIVKYIKPKKRVPYIVATDPSGSGGDYTAIEVIDNRNGEQVCEMHKQKMTSLDIAINGILLGYEYNNAYIVSETNYAPEVIDLYREFDYLNIIMDTFTIAQMRHKQPNKYGFRTTPSNRGSLIGNLEDMIGARGVASAEFTNINLIHSPILLKEAQNFVTRKVYDMMGHEQLKKEANSGAHDDTLMAYAIALEVRKLGQQSFSLLPEEDYTVKAPTKFDMIFGADNFTEEEGDTYADYI